MTKFWLEVGETYAILPADSPVHHAGKFLGWVELDETSMWLAFEVGGPNDLKVRFYNPGHIRSLLPETRPVDIPDAT